MSDDDRIKLIRRLCVDLSRLMKTEITDDVIFYLLSMQSVQDLKDYVKELIDLSSPKAEPFMKQLIESWELFHIERDDHKNVDKGVQSKEEKCDQTFYESAKRSSLGKNKKTTFSPLFGSDGKERSARLPGRHPCDCQCQKHPLVNNCIECGRVVCEQEGSGPCFFCGALVCSRKEQEILSRNSAKSEKLKSYLLKQEFDQDDNNLIKAIQFKDRLLEFDRTSMKRTKVIDDESDYFSTDSNKWLKQKERELLKEKEKNLREQRFASRLGSRKFDFDFAGREIRESISNIYEVDDDDDVMAANYTSGSLESCSIGSVANPDNHLIKPIFTPDDSNPHQEILTPSAKSKLFRHLKIVQDSEVRIMSDEGMCLSMHQPWASLLIAGIKKHEGRIWYTSHRGALWIASTSKKPDQSDINQMELFYKTCYQDDNITFPKHYPSSCLLGRVIVDDCLPQEEYKLQYPYGESESPFVIICSDPIQLKIKFPMKGKHKIYKLEPSLHKGAMKALFQTPLKQNQLQ